MAKRVFNNIPYLMHSILPQSKLNCVHTWLVPRRMFHKSLVKRDGKFNEPIPSNELPRFAGIASFFRLPIQRLDTKGLDACFVGVPVDWGTSNRTGARFGPRFIRAESAMVRRCNVDTGALPYSSINVADIGDIDVTPYDLGQTVEQIYKQFTKFLACGCKVFAVGGDHTITYPILKAYKEKYGPLGLVHLDAHNDVNEHMGGCKLAHGTTFRRAFEEGCIDPCKVAQIGIRGSSTSSECSKWARSKGFREVRAKCLHNKSLVTLMEDVRKQMGNTPVYITFDIDALDPSIAPGTGTPEIAGLTSMQCLEVIRGCKGLCVVGGDLVEVSPPYDKTGNTALTAANFLFEMLCVLPGVKYEN